MTWTNTGLKKLIATNFLEWIEIFVWINIYQNFTGVHFDKTINKATGSQHIYHTWNNAKLQACLCLAMIHGTKIWLLSLTLCRKYCICVRASACVCGLSHEHNTSHLGEAQNLEWRQRNTHPPYSSPPRFCASPVLRLRLLRRHASLPHATLT